ncbi:hypothetical protein JCM18750_37390 [Halostagnicola bangensis]
MQTSIYMGSTKRTTLRLSDEQQRLLDEAKKIVANGRLCVVGTGKDDSGAYWPLSCGLVTLPKSLGEDFYSLSRRQQ